MHSMRHSSSRMRLLRKYGIRAYCQSYIPSDKVSLALPFEATCGTLLVGMNGRWT